jgi:hypothetical protein
VEESKEGEAEDEGSANFSLINAEGIPASAFITDDELPVGPRLEMKKKFERMKKQAEKKAEKKAAQNAQ